MSLKPTLNGKSKVNITLGELQQKVDDPKIQWIEQFLKIPPVE